MARQADLMTRMRTRLQSLAYSSSLYQMMISGPTPKFLAVSPNDIWPGDAKAGQAILDGEFVYGGQCFSCDLTKKSMGLDDWLPAKAGSNWLQMVHGFGWLRDLRGTGGDRARRVARGLVASWLDHFAHWSDAAWDPPVMADRITHIVGMHDFFLLSAESDFRDRVFECLTRQVRHLMRITPASLNGVMAPDPHQPDNDNHRQPLFAGSLYGYNLVRVLRGLIYAGVALPESEKTLGFALSVLPSALGCALTADGLVIERQSSVQARVTKCLIDMRHALRAAAVAAPPALETAIPKACQALRAMRYGDGGLALFHGGHEDDPLFLDAIFSIADHRGRAPKSLPQGGFERLAAGRMLVMVDTGAPPAEGVDGQGHASLSAFEVSVGKERLIVNCGAHPSGNSDDWHKALAATAAHSTLGIADSNSSDVLNGGGLGRRATPSTLQRYRKENGQHLEFSHDGFGNLHATHQRVFALSPDGDELQGEDQVEGPEGLACTLRFHFHPLVQTSLIQNGSAVLLRLPSGIGYRLRLEEGVFTLEESVYYGRPQPRKTVQAVFRGRTQAGANRICWSLLREGKGK